MAINFNKTESCNETECFLCREATVTVDEEPHLVLYCIVIEMKDNASHTPVVKEVSIDAIPQLDDYAYARDLTDEEEERRMKKHTHVYDEVQQTLNNYYIEVAP